MGCDGGTIPRRDEMVKLKKKAEKVGPSVTNFVPLAIHHLQLYSTKFVRHHTRHISLFWLDE